MKERNAGTNATDRMTMNSRLRVQNSKRNGDEKLINVVQVSVVQKQMIT